MYGHPNPANPITFTAVIPNSGEPTRAVPASPRRTCSTRTPTPTACAARCRTTWSTSSAGGPRTATPSARSTTAASPTAWPRCKRGDITPAQFVDVNAKIGGGDINLNPEPERIEADRPALGYLYRSGAINVTNNLDQVAMIDLRGPDPGAFHDAYRVYALRSRLEREFGHTENHVLWRGFVPLLGGVDYVANGIIAMDKWLAAVEKDGRAVPLAQKIIEDKPADVADRCTEGSPIEADLPGEACDAVVDLYASPRIEAGMPFTDDVMRCQRKPLRAADYLPAVFTPDQWAELQKTYPDGVCDYSKPGVDVTPTVPWLTYEGGPGGQAARRPARLGRPELGAAPPASRAPVPAQVQGAPAGRAGAGGSDPSAQVLGEPARPAPAPATLPTHRPGRPRPGLDRPRPGRGRAPACGARGHRVAIGAPESGLLVSTQRTRVLTLREDPQWQRSSPSTSRPVGRSRAA